MLKNKQFLQCLVLVVFIFMMIQWTGHIFDPVGAQDGLDVIKAFHKIDENTLDVIVYGSSRAFKGCDTRVMCDQYGLSAYNYSSNWQSVNTTLLFLKDSLRTQSPKVVCIEVGILDDVNVNVPLDAQIYYTKAMPYFEGKKEYLQQCFGNNYREYLYYYFPIIPFHGNWKDLHSENFIFPGPDRFLESRGYWKTTEISQEEIIDYHEMEQFEIPDESLPFLEEMVHVCKEKNVNVILYTTPYAWIYNYSDAMDKFAEEHNCTYINLFKYLDDIGLDGETDFSDTEHLNQNGAAKVASFLGAYIIQNYEIK